MTCPTNHNRSKSYNIDIIVIILFITFMRGIYNYIHETSYVSRVHSVAAVLYLQSVLHVMLLRPWNTYVLYFYFTTSRSLCAVPYMVAFLQFLNFVLSQHVAQVLSERFWNGSSRLYIYWCHFCCHISTFAEFLLWGLQTLKSSQLVSWSHFCRQKFQHLLTLWRRNFL